MALRTCSRVRSTTREQRALRWGVRPAAVGGATAAARARGGAAEAARSEGGPPAPEPGARRRKKELKKARPKKELKPATLALTLSPSGARK